jgi:DNA-binding beta-propeller fold protein YncE
VATIAVGMEPEELLFTPDGKRAYVANFDTNDFR